MHELPLVVEGFENKIKRLFLKIDQIKKENDYLKRETDELKSQLKQKENQISLLEQKLQELKLAKTLEKSDPFQAKQKINDLLREIEKCYALLNR
ncbi:MAG: hypothetical protein ACOCWC_03085 [Bacteroidota bacterium]